MPEDKGRGGRGPGTRLVPRDELQPGGEGGRPLVPVVDWLAPPGGQAGRAGVGRAVAGGGGGKWLAPSGGEGSQDPPILGRNREREVRAAAPFRPRTLLY